MLATWRKQVINTYLQQGETRRTELSKQKENEINVSLAEQGLNCNFEETEAQTELQEFERQCEFYRQIFDVTSIL